MGVSHLNSRALGTATTLLLMICTPQDAEAQSCKIKTVPSVPVEKFSTAGDLNIGIVLPLHSYDHSKGQCNIDTPPLGVVQRLEAMIFAIDEINKNDSLLYNVTLGYTVVDDCGNEFVGQARALHFIQTSGPCQGTKEENTFYPSEVVAVIGTENSKGTQNIADIMHIYEIPQLTYSTANPETDVHPFFFRILPSELMQVTALVSMLKEFKWSYISVLFSSTSYGHRITIELDRQLNQIGYCVGVLEEVEDTTNFLEIVNQLLAKRAARVVFLVLTRKHARSLFNACSVKYCVGNFQWICSEEVCDDYNLLTTFKVQISGLLMLNYIASSVARFEDYFRHLTLANVSRNPYLQELFQKLYCSAGKCKQDVAIGTNILYKEEKRASLVIDSVYAIAHALDAVLQRCDENTNLRECVQTRVLREAMLEIDFRGENSDITFKADGSVKTGYRITNAFLDNGEIRLQDVGEWSTTQMTFTYFNKSIINWGWGNRPHSSSSAEWNYPVSECSQPCAVGFQAIRLPQPCCWYCERCAANERTVNIRGMPRCMPCPSATNFTWPDSKTRTQCLPIPVTRISIDDATGIVLLGCVAAMEMMLFLVILFYVIYIKHMLIIASGRLTAIFLIVGQVVSSPFVVTFALDFSPLTCMLSLGGVHLSCTVNYVPVLIRSIALYYHSLSSGFQSQMSLKTSSNYFRTYSPNKDKRSLPIYIVVNLSRGNCIKEACTVIFIVAAQVGLMVAAVYLDQRPSEVITIMPSYFNKYVEIKCLHHNAFTIAPLTFNFFLLTISAYYSFKIQLVKGNFYESRFIQAYNISNTMLWAAFFLGYLTSKTYTYQRFWFISVILLTNLFSLTLILWSRIIGIYALQRKHRENKPSDVI